MWGGEVNVCKVDKLLVERDTSHFILTRLCFLLGGSLNSQVSMC